MELGNLKVDTIILRQTENLVQNNQMEEEVK